MKNSRCCLNFQMSQFLTVVRRLLVSLIKIHRLKKCVILVQALNFAICLSAVNAEKSVFEIPCVVTENCSVISGKKMCDTTLGMCSCAEGNVRMNHYNHCLPFAGMGEYCEDDEQCRHSGPNVTCGKWSQRCECISGYEEKESNGKKMCSKSVQVVYEPYIVHMFGNLGTVHIVLGVLTGGLALLALFAGIIQLVRKKYVSARCNGIHSSQFSPDFGYSTTSAPSQSHPFSDSQFTSTLPSGADFACMDGNSTAPPTPGTLGDEDYVVTPPPTYEEAVQSDRAKAPSVMTV